MRDMWKKRTKLLSGLLAVLLLVFAAGVLIFDMPEAAGVPIETNAAISANFEPGCYTARLDVNILNRPDAQAVAIGKVRQGQTVCVYEVRQEGDVWYGRISSEDADTWVVLQTDRIRSFKSEEAQADDTQNENAEATDE